MMSAPMRLSQVSPHRRTSQPIPPPRVKPAIPVVDTRPPVTASPERLRLGVDIPPDTSGLRHDCARVRVNANPLHRGKIKHDAAVVGGEAGDAVSAASDGKRHTLTACELHSAENVDDTVASDD